MYEKRWPTADTAFLVALWAGIAIAFYFALPLAAERYETSVVVFAWPAVVAEVERRRNTLLWLGLALCCIVSLARAWYYSIEALSITVFPGNSYRAIEAILRQTPKAIRQVYVLADKLPLVNPEYMHLILGVPTEIVFIIGIHWNCDEPNNLVAFDPSIAAGVVNLTVTLPACAHFSFRQLIKSKVSANGHLYRNATISYELPEAHNNPNSFDVGGRMTVHVLPNGPARFIIPHGGSNGMAWFDSP